MTHDNGDDDARRVMGENESESLLSTLMSNHPVQPEPDIP